jgi:hypothetical protein
LFIGRARTPAKGARKWLTTLRFTIGENSPEGVAYKLLYLIRGAGATTAKTKDEILDLYAECLLTVENPELRQKGKKAPSRPDQPSKDRAAS